MGQQREECVLFWVAVKEIESLQDASLVYRYINDIVFGGNLSRGGRAFENKRSRLLPCYNGLIFEQLKGEERDIFNLLNAFGFYVEMLYIRPVNRAVDSLEPKGFQRHVIEIILGCRKYRIFHSR